MSFEKFGINDWLAQTKFLIPTHTLEVVARPRLHQKLRQLTTGKPVGLISAQAGYGKTTLLASLPALIPGLKTAWLSLDITDNDWVQFLAALTRSIQEIETGFGLPVQTLLDSLSGAGPGLDIRQVIALLINEIVKTIKEPFVVVLDDLHTITEPAVFQGIDYLVERMPLKMHLFFGTRHEPPLALARWRARGKLLELGEADLRFTTEEATLLLNQHLKLNLGEGEIAALQQRTEGWVAGLHLLTASLEQIVSGDDRRHFIAELTRTKLYIYDFLAEEVLNLQDGITRRFLLETSILAEITPSLCEAVTGRENARSILDEIYRRHLCSQVDPHLNTYRYHDLFAEFLQQRLVQEKPERVAELHYRAARAVELPSRAIHHFLAGHWWEEAAALIGQVGRKMLYQGLYENLQTWIGMLPAQVLENNPHLLFLQGMGSWGNGNIPGSYTFFERAAAGFERQGKTDEQWEALFNLSNNLVGEHRLAEAAAYFEKINTLPVSFDTRLLSSMMYSWFYYWSGDHDRAATLLDEALKTGLGMADPLAIQVLAHNYRLFLGNVPGGPERTLRYCRELRSYKELNYFVRASVNLFESYQLYLQGHLGESLARLKHVYALNQQANLGIWIKIDLNLVGWALLQGCGDLPGLSQHLEEISGPLSQFSSAKNWQFLTDFLFGRYYFLTGLVEKLREICENWTERTDLYFSIPDAAMVRLLTRGSLAISEGSFETAEKLIEEALTYETALEALQTFVSARTMLAHLYMRWNQPLKALTAFEPILAEGEARGQSGYLLHDMRLVIPVLRLAVEKDIRGAQAARILQLLGEKTSPEELLTLQPTPLLQKDPGKERLNTSKTLLSNREFEVLELLAEGLNTRQLAARLTVSELTVKSHVSHIFQKLDANSRLQAISRARELGILS